MWREAPGRTIRRMSDRGWTPELVSGIAFALLSPLAGVLMNTPKAVVYGAAVGLTVVVWVIAHNLAESLIAGPHPTPSPSTASSASPSLLPSASPEGGNAPAVASSTSDIADPPKGKSPRAARQTEGVAINAPVAGPVVIRQGQTGGQVAATIARPATSSCGAGREP